MDAVKETQSALEPVVAKWAAGIPAKFKTLQAFEQLRDELPTMYNTAYAAGLDPGTVVVATITGTFDHAGTPTVRSSSGRARIRTRSRSRSRQNGRGPTGEQVLAFMREADGPVSQVTLAASFGVSRQTIAKRLTALVRGGQVTAEGAGARKTWRATEPTGS